MSVANFYSDDDNGAGPPSESYSGNAIRPSRARTYKAITRRRKAYPSITYQNLGELQGKKRTNADNPPSVEPLDAFVARILSWWDGTIMPLVSRSSNTETVLVIGHGSFTANLMKALGSQRGFDMSLSAGKGKAYNTGISIVEIENDGRGTLVQYSDVGHLKDMEQGVVTGNVDDVDPKTSTSRL